MLCFGQQKCDEQSEQQSMEKVTYKKMHIKHKVNKMHIKQNAMEHLWTTKHNAMEENNFESMS